METAEKSMYLTEIYLDVSVFLNLVSTTMRTITKAKNFATLFWTEQINAIFSKATDNGQSLNAYLEIKPQIFVTQRLDYGRREIICGFMLQNRDVWVHA